VIKKDKDKENRKLQEQLESREAGVTELLEFYNRIETAYVSSLKALKESQIDTTSNSTNFR